MKLSEDKETHSEELNDYGELVSMVKRDLESLKYDILFNFLNKCGMLWNQRVGTELFRLVGVTSFNDLLMRPNQICSATHDNIDGWKCKRLNKQADQEETRKQLWHLEMPGSLLVVNKVEGGCEICSAAFV
ncbi:10364_t:CDS:2 [Ambispora gerdemannii]|uniref:10364_t:CDS:1 n=1 Tax=Ambispora gerdemannii TaxID=144530 RepID=A0A9N9BJ63_9GLOM|nr:10364_t:CDS:2 [Ambispora gerdemannii]